MTAAYIKYNNPLGFCGSDADANSMSQSDITSSTITWLPEKFLVAYGTPPALTFESSLDNSVARNPYGIWATNAAPRAGFSNYSRDWDLNSFGGQVIAITGLSLKWCNTIPYLCTQAVGYPDGSMYIEFVVDADLVNHWWKLRNVTNSGLRYLTNFLPKFIGNTTTGNFNIYDDEGFKRLEWTGPSLVTAPTTIPASTNIGGWWQNYPSCLDEVTMQYSQVSYVFGRYLNAQITQGGRLRDVAFLPSGTSVSVTAMNNLDAVVPVVSSTTAKLRLYLSGIFDAFDTEFLAATLMVNSRAICDLVISKDDQGLLRIKTATAEAYRIIKNVNSTPDYYLTNFRSVSDNEAIPYATLSYLPLWNNQVGTSLSYSTSQSSQPLFYMQKQSAAGVIGGQVVGALGNGLADWFRGQQQYNQNRDLINLGWDNKMKYLQSQIDGQRKLQQDQFQQQKLMNGLSASSVSGNASSLSQSAQGTSGSSGNLLAQASTSASVGGISPTGLQTKPYLNMNAVPPPQAFVKATPSDATIMGIENHPSVAGVKPGVNLPTAPAGTSGLNPEANTFVPQAKTPSASSEN